VQTTPCDVWNEVLAALEALYRDLERDTRRLDELHRGRLTCGEGCTFCCVDNLTVHEVEAEDIRRHHADLLATGTPNPEGACAFLDEKGACRIYAHRPYVCRTQGYPLRWLAEGDHGDMVEWRDICPLNEDGRPIQELLPEDCWTVGPVEERLAELQLEAGGRKLTRVRLRDLFLTKPAPEHDDP
jgi:Fe-S-cluster containining protein